MLKIYNITGGDMQNKLLSMLRLIVVFIIPIFLINCVTPMKNKAKTGESYNVPLVKLVIQSSEEGAAKLVLVEEETLAYLEVIERSPNVKSVTRITNNENEEIYFGQPVMSPKEELMVYSMITQREDNNPYNKKNKSNFMKRTDYNLREKYASNIWKQKIGSEARTRLTYGAGFDTTPAFTPDADYLLFSSERTMHSTSLWRIRINGGGGITRITGSYSTDLAPSISSDGKTIAFTSIPQGSVEGQVWTTDASGNLPTQLREGMGPKFSGDDNQILFLRKTSNNLCNEANNKGRQGIYQIWLMGSDGSSETQLTTNTESCIYDAQWSPDGNWIVYSSNEGVDQGGEKNFDIWIMSKDGTNRVQLTTNGSDDRYPTWSHTGDFIYFNSNRGGAWNIWRFSPVVE